MEDGFGRRSLLRGAAAGITGTVAGCSTIANLFPDTPASPVEQQSTADTVAGTVIGAGDGPLEGATVTALGRGGTELARTDSDGNGGFRLDLSRPVWLRVTASGYQDRVTAGSPARANRITVADGETVSLRFGGDVMFGRRFYDPPSTPRLPREQIEYGQLKADHRRILSYIEPLLASADLTSINLETPLTTEDVLHPTKLYAFTSHPLAGEALSDAGVDYTALGNNHSLDALEPGLRETQATLDDAGISYSGAGLDSERAWEPATVDAGGLTVAMLSCCTIVGAGQEIDWSADRSTGESHTVTEDSRSVTFPDSVGVAEPTSGRLRERVRAANGEADIVVVQIHGGDPYRYRPTDEIRRLTEVAADAGADLVVNHHPHVVGGIERIGSTVVAWTLGNLIFDQTVWETLPSYLLTANVTADGVAGITLDPVILDGFVPKGVVGKPREWILTQAARYSSCPFEAPRQGIVSTPTATETRVQSEPIEGDGRLYEGRQVRIRETGEGVTLGRDLLPTGTFESIQIDETGYSETLWLFDREQAGARPGFGYDDSGGFRLRRVDRNRAPLIVSNSRRIPVSGPLTVTGLYRTEDASDAEVLVNWYPDRRRPAVRSDSWELPATDGEWERFRFELTPPPDGTFVNLVVRLLPPAIGSRLLDVDDLRLIEWTDADSGQGYDHLRASQDTTVTVETVAPNNQTRYWRPLPEQ